MSWPLAQHVDDAGVELAVRTSMMAAVHPAALREQPLHGMGKLDSPEYAQRLRLILKPFGVKPRLATQSADGEATLFATLEASGGLAVLLDTLPAALVGRPFSPALASTVVVLGIPAAQPNAHAERFAQLLREEANRPPSAPPSGRRRSHGKAAQGTRT